MDVEQQPDSFEARHIATRIVHGTDAPFETSHRLRRVRRYVKDHLSDRIRLADAADAAGLERRYFSTYFHRHTGIKFRDWLAVLRVARALELIRDPGNSLERVREACGFGDRRTFQRTFKRWVGMTPSQFRKRTAPPPAEMMAVAHWIREDRDPAQDRLRRRVLGRF